jgi:transposase
MRQYCLRDDHWDWIKDTLPGRAGPVGVAAVDNRRFVDAVLYRYRTGIPWRDLPETLGDWNNTHRRLSRWATRGVWEKTLTLSAAERTTSMQ